MTEEIVRLYTRAALRNVARYAVGVVLGVTLLGLPHASTSAPTAARAAGFNAAAATSTADSPQQIKLREEIRKLRIENDRAEGFLGWLLSAGPLVTVLVGAATLVWTLYKQSRDLVQAKQDSDREAAQWRGQFAEQQRLDTEKSAQWQKEFLRQREQDRADQEAERLRRFDQQLASVVTNVGSPSQAVRLNAAAALGFFVKSDYHTMHCDLLNVLIANLKADPEPVVADLMRRHLAKVLQLLFEPRRELDPDVGDRLNLTGTNLYRFEVHGLDLRGRVTLDIAFARLKYANFHDAVILRAMGGESILDGAHFCRARMGESRFNKAAATEVAVKFHDTNLVSATFVDAQLPRAEFQQARLQGAHFTGADLRGARFEEADLADTRFTGAIFDDAAIRSIVLAKRWRKALFDPEVDEWLERVSRDRGTA